MSTSAGSVVLDVRGMTCASCVRRVERALSRVEGVDAASVNYATETARVECALPVPVGTLVAAVEKAGYHATPATERVSGQRRARSWTPWLLALGAILGAPAVILAMGMDIADVTIISHRFTGWLVVALATPIQVLLGWRYYRGAWASLRHLNPNMDVLVALGTTVAYLYSLWVVTDGAHRHMYFDASVAVLVFVTAGKYFEEESKRNANAALRALAGLLPSTATVIRDGTEKTVEIGAVAPGDTLVVRPGERIAADGLIREGRAAVDESMLTGESIPVERSLGDAVLGGTVSQDGLLHVEVTASGKGTALSRLSELVEEAQGSKAPIQHVVDRISAIFVPVVVLIALAVLLGWGFIADDWVKGMVASVAVLVVACPCALGLATPTAIMVGTGIGAERGILVRNAEVLERLKRLDVVVLDKTGTLTEGRPEVREVVAGPGFESRELLRLVAAAERGSQHPLSRAVVDHADGEGIDLPAATGFESIVARGVRAMVDARSVLVGNRVLLADAGVPVGPDLVARAEALEEGGHTVVFAAVDGHAAGLLAIADAPRATARRSIEALHRLGLRTVLMTGDNPRAAAAIATATGVSEFRAEAKPDDKLALVRELQAQGLAVAMVGDGINDAPALAAADIGIAMSTGTDVAMEAADITLIHGDVSRVAEAILLGRGTVGAIRQNLGWAFGYNVLMIPLAAFALLSPVIAGGAMAMSSLSVMGNSLRLRTRAPKFAAEAGNSWTRPTTSLLSLNRGPVLALAAAVVVLVVPLVTFLLIDRAPDGGGGGSHDGHVQVGLLNWRISIQEEAFHPGATTFAATHTAHDHDHDHGDEGGATHDLVVLQVESDGALTPLAKTKALKPGQREEITVDLPPGEYELHCSVVEEVNGKTVSHIQQGMRTRITVR